MSKAKDVVRRSKAWKEFRQRLIAEQKTDPITGKKLAKGCCAHHLDLDAEHYGDLTIAENFIALNHQSHEIIHYIFGHSGRINHDWRERLEAIRVILEKMDAINTAKGDINNDG